jgi:hypothetical protein
MRGICRKVWFALANEVTLTGTPSQVEWAGRIRQTVVQEFDRVAQAFEVRASGQSGQKQAETRTLIAILEQKRGETLANTRAGYFIHDWQDLSDQVRQLIAKDPRYRQIRDQRAARQTAIEPEASETFSEGLTTS